MVKINLNENYYKSAHNQQYKEFEIDDSRGVITDINFNNITNTTKTYKTLVSVYDNDLQQVCEMLNISRSYVSRLEKSAIEILRNEFIGQYND